MCLTYGAALYQQQLMMKTRYEALAKERGAWAVKRQCEKQVKESEPEGEEITAIKHKGMEIAE